MKRGIINYIPKQKVTHVKPLFYWLEWEVWDYIESRGLVFSPLYDEGFSRLGCVVCPFHSYKEHQHYRTRWPKYFVAFEKAMHRVWNIKKDKIREETFELFLYNWYHGVSVKKKEKKRGGFDLWNVK